ncbi:Hermansky-Pudlak syndrome 1 protein homolog [Geodia barretti]|nr:Hermansky-Pudlak syndrome 1 protein homolog [Geodia barretti]
MEGIDPQSSVGIAEASPDRSELFQTPPTVMPGAYSTREAEDPPFATPGPEADPTFSIPVDEAESMRESVNPSRGFPGRLRNLFGLRGTRGGDVYAQEVVDDEESTKSWRFMEQLVFLQPNTATFIPHRLHCLEVCPGIILVLISEYGLNQLAGTISLVLHHLDEIFVGNRRGGQSVFDLLEESFRRTNSLVKHEFQTTASSTLRQCSVLVQNAWGNLKEAGLRAYVNSSQPDERLVNQARLEASSSNLSRKLVELFEQLFFTPKQREYDTAHVKSRLIRNFSGLRKDYGEFLALKGTVNIPMLNFSMCHPGMVHFILIDRSFDEMITPSVHRDHPVVSHHYHQFYSHKLLSLPLSPRDWRMWTDWPRRKESPVENCSRKLSGIW